MSSKTTYFALALSLLAGVAVSALLSGCQTSVSTGPVTVATSRPPTQSTTESASNETTTAGDPSTQFTSNDESEAGVADAGGGGAGDKPGDDAAGQGASGTTSNSHPAIDKRANAPVKAGDWNQWGGTSYRNNVPIAKSVPTAWKPGSFDRKTKAWDRSKSKNIKWVAQLGSQTYGNPVIAGGKVFVGTNNGAGFLKRYPADFDLGALVCLNEKDGSFLWQHSSEKLPTGRVHDWPLMGICCSPCVEGDRLWFVTSRGEVRCLDTEGFLDGEDDGPVVNDPAKLFEVMRNEDPKLDPVEPALAGLKEGKLIPPLRVKFAAAGLELPDDIAIKADDPGKVWSFAATTGDATRQIRITLQGPRLAAFKILSAADKDEADVVWVFDMMRELRVSQHNMCSCSVTTLGDILFVCTSNGVDESHLVIPSIDAPSFIAMNKHTGKVLWTDKSPGANIHHGQWSSPTAAVLGGVPQVMFGGGDGWLYSFRADEGKDGAPELLWKADLNPKDAVLVLGARGTRNDIIATPVVYDGLVYVAVGQDPEHGEGVGLLWCIDPTKRGDVSDTLVVNRESKKIVPHKRIQAVVAEDGDVVVPNPNTAIVWRYASYDQNNDGKIQFEEIMHRSCGTVAIKNDLLYIADFSGLIHCVDAKNGKVYWTHDMLAGAWGSPLIVNDHVYFGDEDGDIVVFNLSSEKHDPVFQVNMLNSVYSSPIVANETLFIANKDHLFAIAVDDESADKK